MPTYGPVPASFSSLSHRRQVLFLYRHILRQGACFFDERASHWIRARAQETFRKNQSQKDEHRIQKYMSDARKALRLIERANQMDLKAVMRILRLSHGLQGKERRILLQPFVDSTRARSLSTDKLSAAIIASGSTPPPLSPFSPISPIPSLSPSLSSNPVKKKNGTTTITTATDTAAPPLKSPTTIRDLRPQRQLSELLLSSKEDPGPLYFNNQRTVPPILSPPLVSLIQGATGKSVKPVLPQPLFKPLHGKREANLRWRFYTKQMGKVKPPLPGQIRQEIERKSRIGLQRPPRIGTSGFGGDITETLETTQEWIEWEQRIIATIKAWNKTGEEQKANRWENGRFHPSIGGKPAKSHTLTLRSYRRIWQQLLNEVPILDVKLGGEGSDHGKDSMNNKDVLKGTSRDKDSGTGTRWSEQTQTQTSAPSYLVSKSPQSYQARSAAGLKLQALVNDFDQLGFTEDSVAPQGKKNRKKALTA
ncbi:hypothetical protein BGX23_011073 [Mortierella sp. AD031]|nr:hypothetical protein BGX23_011073 [Mortierella sp. AD031]